MSFLYTAPGQASPPSAEFVFSGPNNLEKWGRLVDSLTELCWMNSLASSPSCPAAKHYSKWWVEHKYKCICNHHIFFQFLSDCVWQASVPTCFCTLHGRNPSLGTKPGKRTHLVFRERSLALYTLSSCSSHTGGVKSHIVFSMKHVWSKHTFWNPVQSKLGIPWVASSRC